ncbi:MAG: flagellin lysine-N-methylase [Lachnospiraceae bacterium]|nr:flagellin lysine-N-methylase [Lachnospiraceae bacterium]
MILRYPSYYDKFRCIAGDCESTCCAGWEIDIDDESYRYYMSVPGEFGRRLREHIKQYEPEDEGAYESHGFLLKKNKRCPFLNAENLCDIYRELGEEALCEVCTNTPRNLLEYGGERELSISASCPEAARLLYRSSEITTFVEKEIEDHLDFEESEEEIAFAGLIRRARDGGIRILQYRQLSVYERLAAFLEYAKEVQMCLNENEPERIVTLSPEDFIREREEKTWKKGRLSNGEKHRYGLFLKRMISFTSMESISEEWEEMLKLLERQFAAPSDGAARYEKAITGLQGYLEDSDREYEYEQLLVYYTFLCVSRCVDDYDFLGKAKVVAVSFLMIRDMDAALFVEKGEKYEKADRIKVVGIYARELEHSEENMEYLAEEFLFGEGYRTEDIIDSI